MSSSDICMEWLPELSEYSVGCETERKGERDRVWRGESGCKIWGDWGTGESGENLLEIIECFR
eukprot:scaffold100119_cov22-Tisochrysis_lutea.AAC.2